MNINALARINFIGRLCEIIFGSIKIITSFQNNKIYGYKNYALFLLNIVFTNTATLNLIKM